MNIPNIPSDNIYKFIALSSLILLAISVYFFESLKLELNIEIIELTSEYETHIFELEKTKKMSIELINKLAALTEGVELDTLKQILSQENYQKLLAELEKSKIVRKTTKDNVTTITRELPAQSNEMIFEDELLELKQLDETTNSNSIKIKNKNNILNEKIKQRDNLKSLFNFTIYPLLILMLLGFYMWYYKVQKYQDMIIKAQANQLNKQKD